MQLSWTCHIHSNILMSWMWMHLDQPTDLTPNGMCIWCFLKGWDLMRFVVVMGLMERYLAPGEICKTLEIKGYLPNQLVQELFHQPYCNCSISPCFLPVPLNFCSLMDGGTSLSNIVTQQRWWQCSWPRCQFRYHPPSCPCDDGKNQGRNSCSTPLPQSLKIANVDTAMAKPKFSKHQTINFWRCCATMFLLPAASSNLLIGAIQ